MQQNQCSDTRHSLKTINKKSPQRNNFFEDYAIFSDFLAIIHFHSINNLKNLLKYLKIQKNQVTNIGLF